MITEIAELEVKSGAGPQFIAAIEKAKPLLTKAEGCRGVELNRGIESPDKFVLMVNWETLEHHTEKFVTSADFQSLLALIGAHLAGQPKMYHVEKVA